MPTERFWSDSFDMDLLKVIPGVVDAAAPAAHLRLWTYGGTSYGRLNHPAVWNGYKGTLAYFGLDDTGWWKPSANWTDAPMVECTWLELLRDAWVHQYQALVNGWPVFDTSRAWRMFEQLMGHARGYRNLGPFSVRTIKLGVHGQVVEATQKLLQVAELAPSGGGGHA